MASEIRVNTINNRSGLGTVSITDTGLVVSGIITATTLDTSSTSTFSSDISIADKIIHTGDTNTAIRFPANDTFTVETGGSEALRIDSSQRLLVGRNTSPGQGAQYSRIAIQGFIGSDTGGGDLALMRGESAADMTNLDDIGVIRFSDSGGNRFAFIRARVDGAPSVSNFPGRLEFMTNPGGGETNAEIRMAIKSDGNVGIGTDNPAQSLHVFGSTGTNIQIQQTSGSIYLGSSGSTRFGLSSGANVIQSTSADFAIGSQSGNNLVLGTNNTERLRITSDGDVVVRGPSNPQDYTLSNGIYVQPGNGSSGLTIVSGSATDNAYINFSRGTASHTEQFAFAIGRDGTNNQGVVLVDNAVAARFGSTGIIMPSGKGIDFSATSDAGGMTSELLDDYEEGTWTPELTTSGTDFDSVSYQVRTGSYTKIGDLVFLRCNFYTSSVTKGSASGNVQISGLPFASASLAAVCLHDVRLWNGNPSTGASISGSLVYLFKRSSFNGNDGPLQVSDVSTSFATNLCQFSGCYKIT